ncbi:MAG: helix-turn-helix transcriptional regulator [Rhodosalinus sp.]
MPTQKLLKIRDVCERTALSRSTVYAKIRAGEFPPPVKLGDRAVAWRESDVLEWLAALPTARADR